MYKHLVGILLTIVLCSALASANDSLTIVNLKQADSLFINRNFYLLASSMNIEAQKALEIQAKLYPNPELSGAINLYDPENKKVFHTGGTGQKEVQIQQLILLGGKKEAELNLAKKNTSLAELELKSLISKLKYQLHTNLYTIGQQQILLDVYNKQLQRLDSLVTTHQIQSEKGNIPMKDLVRLKGAYLKLNNDRAELLKDFYIAQKEVQILLQVAQPIVFIFDESDVLSYIKNKALDEIQALALENRADVLLAENDEETARLYLDYQKKLAVPDITVFANYDQRSGAFNNQVNVGFSMPLPLWNKNQGNIKSAKYKIQESEYLVAALKNEVRSQINSNFLFYQQTIKEYKKVVALYDENFDVTLKGMTDNFQKRNVSIVEFVDFFEAYNEVIMEQSRIKIQLVNSALELNRLTGVDIY